MRIEQRNDLKLAIARINSITEQWVEVQRLLSPYDYRGMNSRISNEDYNLNEIQKDLQMKLWESKCPSLKERLSDLLEKIRSQ